MPEGKRKSRTQRRVFVKTPGGRTVMHYRIRAPAKSTCGGCGAVLKGVVRARTGSVGKTSMSAKRPVRPYGGVLCSACARKRIIEKARAQ